MTEQEIITYCNQQMAKIIQDDRPNRINSKIDECMRGRYLAYQDVVEKIRSSRKYPSETINTEAQERYNSLLADYDQQHQKLQRIREEYDQVCYKLEQQKDHLKLLQNRCMGITFGKHCKTCAMINSCNAIVVMKKMTEDYGESAVHALFNYSGEDESNG